MPTGIHGNETRSQQSAPAACCTQWSAWRCALFDVNKPAPVAAVLIKTAHHENNNDNKNNDNNNNKT